MTGDGVAEGGRPAAPRATGRAEPAWLVRARQPGRRLFVAVPVPGAAVRGVAALVEGVRAMDGAAIVGPVGRSGRGSNDVRWVRLDGLHVTIRFLGPTLEPAVSAAADAVAEVGRVGHPFDIHVTGAGAFPDADRPRTLWLGIGAGQTELGALAATLDAALGTRGWPSELREFRPHLTLARSDGVRAGPRLAHRLIAAAEGFSVRWRATSLALFESRTGNGPARYVPLVEVPLGGTPAIAETLVGRPGTDGTIGGDTREPTPPVPAQGEPGSS